MKPSALLNPILLELLGSRSLAGRSLEQRLGQIKTLRQESPEASELVDRVLLERCEQAQKGLEQAQAHQQELKAMLDKVLAEPWLTAVFVGPLASAGGDRAYVQHGGMRRVVNVAPAVTLGALRAGDQVFLNHELNVLTGVSPEGPPLFGELAAFERFTGSGMLVVKYRDDEMVLQPAHALRGERLKPGDVVRFDRSLWMAFERLDPAGANEFMLEEVPALSRDLLGGQESNFEKFFSALCCHLTAPEKARLYRRNGRRTLLLIGPPGCGKTLMTRIVASELARITGRKCRIAVVKPAAWESPYVGLTQKAIRDTFQMLRDGVREGETAILFIDEIESIARTRGHFTNLHGDKHLGALLAELDGFQDRSNVAIIAATNRKDLLDPALLSRFGTEIRVGRPDRRAAEAIFKTHLPDSLPFSPNGELAARTHEELIQVAVSRLYAPNADNELCRLRFRDGKERTIVAGELVSGRFIAQVCESAIDHSFARDVRGGEPGISCADMELALSEGLDRLRTTLTPRNAHEHLADLPQDIDVVSVEPIRRRLTQPRRYLTFDPTE